MAQFGNLPGQVPEHEGSEPRWVSFRSSQLFDHPEMRELYHSQGLPVERITEGEAWIVEPEEGTGRPVLCEAGGFLSCGGLVVHREDRLVRVDLDMSGHGAFAGEVLLEIALLRSAGVTGAGYLLPVVSGRVWLQLETEVFGFRTTIFSRKGDQRRPLVFGPRILLS